MEFNDFDLGPEELGLFLAMSEQMAEEERVRRHLIEEESENNGDLSDFEPHPSRGRGKKPLRPFEQYVDDICHGRKKIGDPSEYGYDFRRQVKRPKSVENPQPIWIGNVRLFQAHLVSDRFITIIEQVLKRYHDHRIQSISFSGEGYPLKNGRPIFAVYLRKKRAVVFNLLRHFENAEQIALKANSGFTIRALLWHSMLHSLLHEIHHSISLAPDGEETVKEQKNEEEQADQWCKKEFGNIAQEIDIEPPYMEEEPFFRACFNDLMIRELEKGNQSWAEKQKLLLDAGLMYWDEKSYAAIETMASFYEVQSEEKKPDMQDTQVQKGLKQAERRLQRFLQSEAKET